MNQENEAPVLPQAPASHAANPRRETFTGGSDAVGQILDESLTGDLGSGSFVFAQPTTKPNDRRMTADAGDIADMIAGLEEEEQSRVTKSSDVNHRTARDSIETVRLLDSISDILTEQNSQGAPIHERGPFSDEVSEYDDDTMTMDTMDLLSAADHQFQQIDPRPVIATQDLLDHDDDDGDNQSTISSLGSLRSFLNNSSILNDSLALAAPTTQTQTQTYRSPPKTTVPSTIGLRSCLSSSKKPKKTLLLSAKKSVAFGSPSAVEFNKSSPTTKFTPMKQVDAKLMFSMSIPEQPTYDEETEENSRILEQWDRLANTSDCSEGSEGNDGNKERQDGMEHQTGNRKRNRLDTDLDQDQGEQEGEEEEEGFMFDTLSPKKRNVRRKSVIKAPQTPPKDKKNLRRQSLAAVAAVVPTAQNSNQLKRRRKSLSYVKSHSTVDVSEGPFSAPPVEQNEGVGPDRDTNSVIYSPMNDRLSRQDQSNSELLDESRTQELPPNLMELMNQNDIKRSIPRTPPSRRRESVSTPLSERSEGMPLTLLVHSNALNDSIQETRRRGESRGGVSDGEENPLNASLMSGYSDREPTRTIPLESNLRSLMDTLIQDQGQEDQSVSSKSSLSQLQQLDSLLRPHDGDEDISDINESLVTSTRSSPILSRPNNTSRSLHTRPNDYEEDISGDETEELETNLGKLVSKVLSQTPSPSPRKEMRRPFTSPLQPSSRQSPLVTPPSRKEKVPLRGIPEEEDEKSVRSFVTEEDLDDLRAESDGVCSPLQLSPDDSRGEPEDVDVTTSFLDISLRHTQPMQQTTTPKLLKRFRNLNSGRQSLNTPSSSLSSSTRRAVSSNATTTQSTALSTSLRSSGRRGVKRYSLPSGGLTEVDEEQEGDEDAMPRVHKKGRQSEGIVSLKRIKAATVRASAPLPQPQFTLHNFIQFLSSLGLQIQPEDQDEREGEGAPSRVVVMRKYSFLHSLRPSRVDNDDAPDLSSTTLHQFIESILQILSEKDFDEILTETAEDECFTLIAQIFSYVPQAAISECQENQLIPTLSDLFNRWKTFMTNTDRRFPALQLAYETYKDSPSSCASSASVSSHTSSTMSSLSSTTAHLSDLELQRLAIQNAVNCCIHNSLRQWLSLETKLIIMCSEELGAKRGQLCHENDEVRSELNEEKMRRRGQWRDERREELEKKREQLVSRRDEIQRKRLLCQEKKKALLSLKEERKNHLIERAKRYETEAAQASALPSALPTALPSVSPARGLSESSSGHQSDETMDELRILSQELQQKIQSRNDSLQTLNLLRDCSVKCYQSDLLVFQFHFLKNFSYQVSLKLTLHRQKPQPTARRASYRPSLGGNKHQLGATSGGVVLQVSKITVERVLPVSDESHTTGAAAVRDEEETFCREYCEEYLFNNQRRGPFSESYLDQVTKPSHIPQFIHAVSLLSSSPLLSSAHPSASQVSGYIGTLRSTLSWLQRKNLISRTQLMSRDQEAVPAHEWYWQVDTSTSCCKVVLSHATNGGQIDIPLTILVTGDVNLLPIHLLSEHAKVRDTRSLSRPCLTDLSTDRQLISFQGSHVFITKYYEPLLFALWLLSYRSAPSRLSISGRQVSSSWLLGRAGQWIGALNATSKHVTYQAHMTSLCLPSSPER
jgi:hypothetical protein